MGLRCKGCGSEAHIKNGFMRGKQRYRCKACGLNFTDTPPPGKPLAMIAGAGAMQLAALSLNVILWWRFLPRRDDDSLVIEDEDDD